MTVTIRSATAADLGACDEICLRTGWSGEDATAYYTDPALLGQVYARPYLLLPEGIGFVAEDAAGVAGYVLGTPDTRRFEEACERHWWPALRARHRDPGTSSPVGLSPDDRLHALIHRPVPAPEEVIADFPAHLHIDLLPRLQGSGTGRVLIERFLGRLEAAGVPGVHLGVGRANERAVGFYRHLGFTTLLERPDALVLGHRLG
ncbi:GNAT family N-acetyltransferase [Nocardioides sp. DS6]|uniref:GNAT family N-acetyltransferase n=1 Tax=Nocardioides eburneus TaxID=3231482 RepID=A0ABV3SYK2_9ACTN